MKLRTRLIIAAVAALVLATGPGSLIAQSGCGIPPIAPIPPIGCKKLVAQCVCDEKGKNCHYVFICQK